jgi:hypothetical protein
MELPRRGQTESETAESKGSLQDACAPVAGRELAQGYLRATRHASWMLYDVDVKRRTTKQTRARGRQNKREHVQSSSVASPVPSRLNLLWAGFGSGAI